jgi:hypothetical protein
MAADMEESLYSSRSIKIFAKDYDSLHTTRMNRQEDSGEHGSIISFLGSTIDRQEKTTYEHAFKSSGSSIG